MVQVDSSENVAERTCHLLYFQERSHVNTWERDCSDCSQESIPLPNIPQCLKIIPQSEFKSCCGNLKFFFPISFFLSEDREKSFKLLGTFGHKLLASLRDCYEITSRMISSWVINFSFLNIPPGAHLLNV